MDRAAASRTCNVGHCYAPVTASELYYTPNYKLEADDKSSPLKITILSELGLFIWDSRRNFTMTDCTSEWNKRSESFAVFD